LSVQKNEVYSNFIYITIKHPKFLALMEKIYFHLMQINEKHQLIPEFGNQILKLELVYQNHIIIKLIQLIVLLLYI